MLIIISITFSSTTTDPFNKLKTIAQLVRIIYDRYVEEVDMNKVLNGALTGMLNELDPHSSFIPAEDLEGIDELFRGDFEGIGIEFSLIDGYITVISPIPDTLLIVLVSYQVIKLQKLMVNQHIKSPKKM